MDKRAGVIVGVDVAAGIKVIGATGAVASEPIGAVVSDFFFCVL